MKKLDTTLLCGLLTSQRESLPPTSWNVYYGVKLTEQIELLTTVPHYSALWQEGGPWLAEVREWIKERAINGSDVAWGTQEQLRFPSLSVKDLEELAARIATATLLGFLNKRS